MRAFFLVVVALLAACASGYQQFYKQYQDPKILPNVQILREGETPKIYSSSDLDRDVKVARSRNYQLVGVSNFNGGLESENAIILQAQRVGATLVLVKSEFTETRAITTPLFLPGNQTSYYGSTVVPLTSHQRRFDQAAVYFVKSTRTPRFGITPIDLPAEMRVKIERNSGALVELVYEGTPAFTANLLPGDVILELDGVSVQNAEHAGALMTAVPKQTRTCTLKVWRNGVERVITLALSEN